MLPDSSSNKSFRLRCRAEQVYLRLKSENGVSQMLPMLRDGQQEWKLDVSLEPGVYHYRYYYVAPGERLMMYHPPVEIARKMQIDELDGVLHVGDGAPNTQPPQRARTQDRSRRRDNVHDVDLRFPNDRGVHLEHEPMR